MGGYQIIDLKNEEFTDGAAKVVPGIHALIEGTRKAILLANVQIDGVEYHDAFVALVGSPYAGSLYGYDLSITSEDNVTFTKQAG